MEAKIQPPNGHRLRARPHRVATATIAPIGGIHPVIEAPDQPVNVVLGILYRETGEQRLTDVSDAIVVGISQPQNIWRLGHQHPITPGKHRGGILEVVREHRPGLEIPVQVKILQTLDAPHGQRCLRSTRVPAHLDHIHPPIGIKREPDGINHSRFARDQFESHVLRESRRRDECLGGK